MLHYLRACSGSLEGSVFVLGQRTLLGRCGEADIQLTELEVSRRHALILLGQRGRLRIGDLESVNGTFVNGERVDGQVLHPGALLRLGRSHFVYGETVEKSHVEGAPEEELFQLLSGPAEEGTIALPASLQAAARRFDENHSDETHTMSRADLLVAETVPISVESEAPVSWLGANIGSDSAVRRPGAQAEETR
ncbi:MAG: FHA domain-containing protein [Deltaproteobacteria bacterium]|nr:FHA domain-containing protein [Deltaproteobacteria bacterium]